jgi:hypothetical protein
MVFMNFDDDDVAIEILDEGVTESRQRFPYLFPHRDARRERPRAFSRAQSAQTNAPRANIPHANAATVNVITTPRKAFQFCRK